MRSGQATPGEPVVLLPDQAAVLVVVMLRGVLLPACTTYMAKARMKHITPGKRSRMTSTSQLKQNKVYDTVEPMEKRNPRHVWTFIQGEGEHMHAYRMELKESGQWDYK